MAKVTRKKRTTEEPTEGERHPGNTQVSPQAQGDATEKRPSLFSFVGRNLRMVRQRKGLSMDRLSEMSGVSVPAIQRVEVGESNFSSQTLEDLANALKVNIVSLYAVSSIQQSSLTGDQVHPSIDQVAKLYMDMLLAQHN